MCDDDKTPTGTRYDALRMIALDDWSKRRAQFANYLAYGVDAELQMGAVSGVADVDVPEATQLLLGALKYLNTTNRNLAIGGLVRSDARRSALIDALEKRRVELASLTEAHRAALLDTKDAALRQRGMKALSR